MLRSLTYFFLMLLLTGAGAHGAVSVPPGFSVTQVAAGLQSPTAMALAPDGRLFICEQGGRVRLVKTDVLIAQPLLSISVDSLGERGLLGVAFDPNFGSNNYFYLYYTATTPSAHNRVSRFLADGDTAVAGSEVVIIDLDSLSGSIIHNGGAIHFGPDDKLYIATGDNATSVNAQSTTNVFGKMLRINADGSIPTDNPFYDATAGIDRAIWAIGLRNPFTFAFQPATGRMFINDVGENSWEEIDEGIAGANFGWPASEGFTIDLSYQNPIFAYSHGSTDTTGCAITGGEFYNPLNASFPASYLGRYFYADYCTGWIRTFNPVDSSSAPFATGILLPVDVHIDTGGSLYYLARNVLGGTGFVGKIKYTPQFPPTFALQPVDLTIPVGDTASFTAAASGDPPITYQWQRDGANITGANSPAFSLMNAQLSDSGSQFRCIATNPFGNDTSAVALLRVVINQRPAAHITSPSQGFFYKGGDTVFYAGTGTDPEQDSLPPSSFTWQVDFHHDEHLHPFIPPTTGSSSGSFVVPVIGETSDTVWYEIILVVTDSGGLSDTTFVNVFPVKSTSTVTSIPTGLTILLDGHPRITPFTFTGVAGIVRSLNAPSPQTPGEQSIEFASWSDGGAASHTISTPQTNSTFTAAYVASPVAPSLVSPAQNATDQALTPVLRWRSASGATAYRVQVASDSGFSVIVLDDPTVNDTARQLSGLNVTSSYYWRVRSLKGSGFSAWSAIRQFTTVAPLVNVKAFLQGPFTAGSMSVALRSAGYIPP